MKLFPFDPSRPRTSSNPTELPALLAESAQKQVYNLICPVLSIDRVSLLVAQKLLRESTDQNHPKEGVGFAPASSVESRCSPPPRPPRRKRSAEMADQSMQILLYHRKGAFDVAMALQLSRFS